MSEIKKNLVEKQEMAAPFRVGKWGDHVQYQCLLCAWDCLDDEASYWEHWAVRHKPLPPVNHSGGILVADKRGNPVG